MENKIVLGIAGQNWNYWYPNLSNLTNDLDSYLMYGNSITRTGTFSWGSTSNVINIGNYKVTWDSANKKISIEDTTSNTTVNDVYNFQIIVKIGKYVYCAGPKNMQEAINQIGIAGETASLW